MKYIPDRKVLSAGLAGVLAWALVLFGPRIGLSVTLDTALPLTVALMGAVAYLVPPSAKDVIKRVNDDIAAVAGYLPAPAPLAKAIDPAVKP